MAPHPVLHPDLLSRCRDAIMQAPSLLPELPGTIADDSSAKRHWATVLDALQGTSLTGLVTGGGATVAVFDSKLAALPSTDPEHQQVLNALTSIKLVSPAVFDLLAAYVIGIVTVHRASPHPSGLESSVDVRTATFDHWKPEMGRFVGSSTGHLGLLWIEAGLTKSDLVCGIVHEFVHLALNMVDMAIGIFTSAAYDGSLRAPSPVVPDACGRPYAMAMHALVVKSALQHLGLRMSTDPPGAFDFHAFARGLLAGGDEGLTVQGRAFFEDVCAWERGGHEARGLQLIATPSAAQRYAAAHSKPVLLFWNVGYTKQDWLLCYEVAEDGAIIFDGLRMINKTHQSEYCSQEMELEFSVEKKPFNSPLRDLPCGNRLQHVHEIPDDFMVRVEDPFNTKYDAVRAKFDFVNINERYGQSRLFLPNGQPHHGPIQGPAWADQKEVPPGQMGSSELTVAEVCGLPPPRIVQVFASLADDCVVELTCFSLDGERLGSIRVSDSGTTLFHDVRAKLANAADTAVGLMRFVTQDGMLLGTEHGEHSVAELFLSSDERVLSLCP